MTIERLRPAIVEGLGTGLLLFVIVGSGITAERLSSDPGLQLVLHAVAVGSGIAVLIAVLAGVSGAHFNPAVTVGFWRRGTIDTPTALAYATAQLTGAFVGVGLASLVGGESLFASSSAGRATGPAAAGELIGTFFLVLAILVLANQDRKMWIPAAVGGWVTAMILATPSGGLLNPAATLARTLTDTYTAIAPPAAVVFAVAQLLAAMAAVPLSRRLVPVPELKGTS
ncbi:MAG: aquaporin [Acidimicrobiia bacterium]